MRLKAFVFVAIKKSHSLFYANLSEPKNIKSNGCMRSGVYGTSANNMIPLQRNN